MNGESRTDLIQVDDPNESLLGDGAVTFDVDVRFKSHLPTRQESSGAWPVGFVNARVHFNPDAQF
jgi:hypothetical protein